MSHSSEDRLHEPNLDPRPGSAQIIPFERPPNVLQRAVQLRAHEALERDRERKKFRPAPLRWTVSLALATIPVLMLLGAVDALVRVFHHVNASFILPAAENQTPASSSTPRESVSQPGVVILQRLQEDSSAPEAPAAPPPK